MTISKRIVNTLITVLLLAVCTNTVTSQSLDANGCVLIGGVYDPATKLCRCKPSFDGVGDICCAPESDHDICVITGDPTLRSINKERVSLNIPCSVCVNVMHGETQDGKECVWEVLASSNIREHGAIYNSMIKVAVSINKKSPSYFEFDGNDVLNPVTDTNFNLRADGTASVDIEGEGIQLSYNADAELWTIMGCQNKLVFRPKKEGVTGSPGLYMQAAKGSTKMSLQQGNLCDLQSSFDDSIPWKYGVLDNALKIRLNFNTEQKTSIPDYDATCSKLDNLMDTFCQGISGDAIQKCGVLLYQSDVRYCLDAAGVKGNGISDLFHKCMETYCDGDGSLCDEFKSNPAIQTCTPYLTDCETWPYYF